MGGTNIYDPLKSVFDQDNGYKKRIFLLTDGCIEREHETIQLIKDNCQNDGKNKIFTFGLGSGASRSLVIDSAKSGKGDYCFVEDTNLEPLKAKVIEMLQKAAEPALLDCSFSFMENRAPLDQESLFDPSQVYDLGQMFRNQYVQQYTVMKVDQFEKDLCCIFKSAFDPATKKPIEQKYLKDQFVEIIPIKDDIVDDEEEEVENGASEWDSHLFELAAKKRID